jgi:flagella basal body P-ring formation protein FlgA
MTLPTPVFLFVAALALSPLTGRADTEAVTESQKIHQLQLVAEVVVDAQGILLPRVANLIPGVSLPAIKIGDAPGVGAPIFLTQQEIQERLAKIAPDLHITNWTGADKVRVVRKSRPMAEQELIELLTASLQADWVKEAGDVEIKLVRALPPIQVPDGPIHGRIVGLPAGSLSPNLSLRFELVAGQELVGTWSTFVKLQVMRDVFIAQRNLKKGDPFQTMDFIRERRDLLICRDALIELPEHEQAIELVESVPTGAILKARSLRLRPVVQRGDVLDALVQDGPLSIVVKVEALESGAPGQSVRVRNPITKKEIRGKVRDEQTVVVSL